VNIRPAGPADFDAFVDSLTAAFGGRHSPAERERDRRLFEPERILLAESDGRLLGTAASLSLQLAVPGALCPVAGVTGVGVAADARRQGVLNALMERQLADIRAGGFEPVAVLFASEAAIYPRFGYGLASRELRISVPGRPAYRVDVTGPVRVGPAAGLRAEVMAGYERCWRSRPGYFARSAEFWENVLADDDDGGKRSGPLTAVLAGDGYALYRTTLDWQDGQAAGKVDVVELLAGDPASEARLWAHLTGLDLMSEVRMRGVAVDFPLPALLVDPRAVRAQVGDNLWVRLVDVPRALAARRYAIELDLCLRVHDTRCAWNDGTFRLTVHTDEVHCESTGDQPDLELDVAGLSAAYLGGTTLFQLAAVGAVREHRPGTLLPASLAFRGMREPLCPWIF
jgi:predicted acetyltransferase